MEHQAQSLLLQENSQVKVSDSEEEARIRVELETDVERDLERELKDEIYHLALRLRRLYQHQRDKHNTSYKANKIQVSQEKHIIFTKKMENDNGYKNKGLLEVKISIKMERGTKVEIKDNKKPHIHVDNKHHKYNKVSNSKYATKKFDWTKSLRAGPPKPSLFVVRNKLEAQKQHPRFRGQSKGNKVVACA